MPNKVYVLPPEEGWIVDRFVKEWNEDNADISTNDPAEADVVWLLADWCWEKLAASGNLTEKKVITTVHHIVPEKFNDNEIKNFLIRDHFTTVYHVYNEETKDFIRNYTKKPIHLIKYWANQKIWQKNKKTSKSDIREKYLLPSEAYVVGSFQRDTEGKDLISPKLEKGPDLLADYLESINNEKLHVVLAGWRRQYIINRLVKANIKFSYFERPNHDVINELYQCLDLYPVTARCEGGPQSLIECGLLDVPVISRPVGIAEQVLPKSAIHEDVKYAIPSIPNVKDWQLPAGYSSYRNLISSL